jgi:uncharacterized YccA/Bax inhibitor family protein
MAKLSRSNPAFRAGVFTGARTDASDGTMTLSGTLGKTAVLLLLTIASTLYTWSQVAPTGNVGSVIMIGALGGFVVALLTIFNPRWSPVTAPIYAVLEGLTVGGVSVLYNAIPKYRGLPAEAVLITFSVAAVMLAMYALGIIRATERTRAIVMAATFGVFVYYLFDLGLSMFGARMPLMVGGGTAGIVFSLVICGIAAFNLILDFGSITDGIENGAPQWAEWYGGFSVLVTLVWLYLEVLRLLRRRR